MHTLIPFIKEFKFPKKQELSDTIRSFSKKELTVFIGALTIAFILALALVQKINRTFMVYIPADGGSITEGIVGMPTLINPALALSDADKDLTAIVYSGLMRKNNDGTFIPDLAESYSISPDGKQYTFTIKHHALFHDGQKVTADDVIFTIEKIKDPLIKSPRRINWDGVSVEKKDDYTVIFTLKQPYISFMDNTTIGILPMHIWKNVSAAEFGLSNLNIKAIGSGPYSIVSVSKNNEGIPESYELKRFPSFTLGTPHIKNIRIISYANEKDLVDALVDKTIDQAGSISPENAQKIKSEGYEIQSSTLPRMFGIFFNNANNRVLADASVIKALDKTLDRTEIINQVLYGYGSPIHNPIPANISDMVSNDETYRNATPDEAKSILDKAGWIVGADGIRVKGAEKTVTRTKKVGKKTVTETVKVPAGGPVTRLSFSLTTGDTPELKKAANVIKEQFAGLGVDVEIKIYETGQLNQIIRARGYEALFFGQIVNHESDLFSFWHSSQKIDPGLNIALYSDPTADSILESIQKTLDQNARLKKYDEFTKQFEKNIPALLVYSPHYIYATKKGLNHVSLDAVATPSDRFSSIYGWYADTDHVWKIFTK